MPPAPLIRKRQSKILATLGPGTRSPKVVEMLAMAGVDVFRINFSHGTHDEHRMALETVRHAEARLGRPIGILADLQGPKVRVGTFSDGKVKFGFNETLSLVAGETTDQAGTIPVPHPEILDTLVVGDEILANDGMIRFTVSEAGDAPKVTCALPGELSDRKGFTVRGKALPLQALSEKDRQDLAFAMELDVDFVALSFVQSVEDVLEAKALITNKAPLIAKLEKPAAIKNLFPILDATDGVMVARGDLGVEFPAEDVPVIQRRIIRAARAAGKPVIVATQMLESMIDNAAPTRAEASDVATAIYQGVDAVMLSAETAVGRHPATAVAIMDRIMSATERAEDHREAMDQFSGGAKDDLPVDIIADAAFRLAGNAGATALALRTGSTRRLIRFSRQRGPVPILYSSNDKHRLRRAQLLWGVHALEMGPGGDDEWVERVHTRSGMIGATAWSAWRGEDEGDVSAWLMGVVNEDGS
ncbi:MAG: pyruvate kinase [Pseudomonadota bacterium]